MDPSTWPKKKEAPKIQEPAPSDGEKKDEEYNPYGDFDNTVTDDNLVDMSEEEMIHQPFLLDPQVLVRDVLLETGITVKDFVRFEVGQNTLA